LAKADRSSTGADPRSARAAAQGGYQLRTHGGRVPVQWLIGPAGWALFVHQPYGVFDLTGARRRIQGLSGRHRSHAAASRLLRGRRARAGSDHGRVRPAHRLSRECRRCGRSAIKQSHRTLASRDEILQEAKTFREKKLPCETLIYLGTGFCPSGWNTDNGEFAFNTKVFPDPPAMIRQLHDDHFKVVLHIVLEGRKLTGATSDACTAAPLPSGRTPDGKWPDNREVSCYWPVPQTARRRRRRRVVARSG
jgi:alpha-glucosidase/alpha-D-xyloside xylohydrolase